MHRRMNPRETKRMMQRMGMNMDSLPDVEQVIIKTSSKHLFIEAPEVAILNLQGQKIFQIIGGQIREQPPQRGVASPAKFVVSEEDARLVADQTGKKIGEARAALEECDGDLAKAILLLQSQ